MISTPTKVYYKGTVYHEVGIKETSDCYKALVTKELLHDLDSLKEVVVENEEYSVEINWYC